MVEFSVKYEGSFRCLSTHGPSGAVLPTDAPKDNLGKGEAFSPTDLTATSLAACMLTTMAIVVQKKSLQAVLDGASAKVRKHMTAEPPRRIAKIEVEVTIPLPESHPDREVLEHAARNCPVSLSLHPEVEQAVTFVWKK
ncbi:MAG: OsmC family protein [Terrimicrobiaceae bacterium]